MKHQNEGGPSLQACFRLIREYSVTPIADLKSLLQWTIYNYLIGNADAHGKNISILFTQQGLKLAPFYDLLSTAIYPNLNSKAAMKISGEYKPEWIAIRHWERFAEHTGVNSRIVFQNLKKMSAMIMIEAESLKESFSKTHGENHAVNKISKLIDSRAKRVLMSLRNVHGIT